MNEVECAWVAGILEGEGSFTFGSEGGRVGKPKVRQIRISCGMTDLDIIERLFDYAKIGNLNLERRIDPRRDYCKQMYIWNATKRSDVIPFMEEIRPHMGLRRGAKIDELLQYAVDNPLLYNQPVICGTRRAYRKGCRCAECRAATAKYARDNNQRKRLLNVQTPQD